MSARYLVFQTSFLGDTVLTTPLIAHLAEYGSVDVVTIPASAPLLANHPAIAERLVYDKRGRDRGIAGILRLARGLRARRYDAVALAQGSVRSGAVAHLAGIPVRAGFATSAGRRFYNRIVPPTIADHHAGKLLALGAAITGGTPPLDAPRPRLYPGDAERRAVDELLDRSGWHGEPLVAVAPGSVWATKRWPGYAELAPLVDDIGRLVVVGGAADEALAASIGEALAPGRVIDATGRLSLLASAELIGRARALITNDSAPLHLASAMDTPTVAIFGPTVPEFGFGPLASRSRVVGHPDLECRPCDRHGPQRCPLGHWRCMREISPRHVADVLRELLSS